MSRSESPGGGVRLRASKKSKTSQVALSGDEDVALLKKAVAPRPAPAQKQSELSYRIAWAVVTVVAFVTRFWKISHPDEVVFDEVHFGKVS